MVCIRSILTPLSKRSRGQVWGLYIARDHEGKFIATATKLVESVLEPREAEALAFRWAIVYVTELCLMNVV